MFLAFVFLVLLAAVLGVWQLGVSGNTDRNLAGPRAYAQNLTMWHQAAMLYASDIDGNPNNGMQQPDCTTTGVAGQNWGGYPPPGTPPCFLKIPEDSPGASPKPSIEKTIQTISPGYQKMENWKSWYYIKRNSGGINEGYVITLYKDPNPTGSSNLEAGYLKPSYVAEGLKQNMGFDRSGVGIVRSCPSGSTTCNVKFDPLAVEGSTADNALEIIINSQVPSDFSLNDLIGGAGIMTRVQ